MLLTLTVPFANVAHAAIVDRIAAVVDGEVITLSQVYELGGPYIESSPDRRAAELEVLDALIERALVSQEIDALGLSVTREELDRTVDDVARQNVLTRDQLRIEVEKSGIAWSIYKDELEQSLSEMKFQQMVILPRVAVTEDEVKDLYNRRVRKLAGKRRELHAILIPFPPGASPGEKAAVAESALAITEAFSAGTAWPQLVAEHPESVLYSQGGKLGEFERGEAIAEIDAVAFDLAVGAISAPLELPTGFAVVYVADETEAEAPALELVYADLEFELQQEKAAEELALWVQQARRRAVVEVMLAPEG